MWVLTVFVCCFLAALSEVKGEVNCDTLGILLYEDIGCKPVKQNGSECPVKYDCDEFSGKSTTCLLRGRNFEPHERVSRNVTYPSCKGQCFCNEGGSFTCAVLDCPEWLGSHLPRECYRKYEHDKCCSVGKICPAANEIVTTCNINGKTIREGQRFTPKNACSKCICSSNFNGKIEEPHCKRMTCNVQIGNGDKLQNNCAPFYYRSSEKDNSALCCPYEWICPSESDEIIQINRDVKQDSDLTCKFGSKTLQLGEGLEKEVQLYGSKKRAKCECILPPLLTCKKA